jgi:hypothetical protein
MLATMIKQWNPISQQYAPQSRLDSFTNKVSHVSLLDTTVRILATEAGHGTSSIKPNVATQNGAVK